MLKQWLSLLLSKFYSKQESDLVGHQAMPSENKIVLTPAVLEASHWMDMLNATAVSDGYVVAQASSTAQNGFLAIRQNPNQTVVTGTGNVNQVPILTLPISKGMSFTVLGDKVKNLSVWFVPIIGGGYQTLKKIILQGGNLCLNSLLASLRRSSFLTRRSGYANNPFLVRRLSLRSLGMEPATKILCLQETGLYALPLRVALGQECFRKQIYRDVCCKTTTENTRRLLFKLVKEKLSTSILQVLKQRLLVFGLFPQLVANRFVLGGAL